MTIEQFEEAFIIHKKIEVLKEAKRKIEDGLCIMIGNYRLDQDIDFHEKAANALIKLIDEELKLETKKISKI